MFNQHVPADLDALIDPTRPAPGIGKAAQHLGSELDQILSRFYETRINPLLRGLIDEGLHTDLVLHYCGAVLRGHGRNLVEDGELEDLVNEELGHAQEGSNPKTDR